MTTEQELDKEIARWQKAIYKLCCASVGEENEQLIDGGGCDSGDPLDFSLDEIGSALTFWENKYDEAQVDADTAMKDYQDLGKELVNLSAERNRFCDALRFYAQNPNGDNGVTAEDFLRQFGEVKYIESDEEPDRTVQPPVYEKLSEGYTLTDKGLIANLYIDCANGCATFDRAVLPLCTMIQPIVLRDRSDWKTRMVVSRFLEAIRERTELNILAIKYEACYGIDHWGGVIKQILDHCIKRRNK